MAEIYKYYINLAGFPAVWTEIFPEDNSLKLSFKRHKTYHACIETILEGEFLLVGSIFDLVISKFDEDGNVDIPLNIYIGDNITGTLICEATITDFNDFDYNQKKVTFKDFYVYNENSEIIKRLENKMNWYMLWYLSLYSPEIVTMYDIKYSELLTYSNWAFNIADCIDNAFSDGWLTYGMIDEDDAWFNTELIPLNNLRLAPVVSCGLLNPGDWFGKSLSDLSLKNILESFQNMFNAYWYGTNVGGYIRMKFKLPSEFIENTLDVTALTTHFNRRNYDREYNYLKEKMVFHENNDALKEDDTEPDEDFSGTYISYDKEATNVNEKQIVFQTKAVTNTNDSLSTSGWFCGYVDPADDILRVENGFLSGDSKKNGRLCGANLLDNYHRDFIHTDKNNFTICGEASTGKPTHYKPFISLPDINITLDTFEFYDSLLWNTDGGINTYALVTEQVLDLNKNLTTFKSVLFKKEVVS